MASTHLAVLGSPIEHSKSPAIHAAAYNQLGLDWDYGRYRIEPDELKSFLSLRDETWRGLSLTMPLKVAAFDLSTPSCPVASATGVVNTLLHTEAGWEGYNTDAYGITKAIATQTESVFDEVAILGSGATARSAINAITYKYPQARIRVFARKPTTVMGLEVSPLEEFFSSPSQQLTISTLPNSVVFPALDVSSEAVFFDVSYEPWPSLNSKHWQPANRISGLEMLVWQAVIQIRIFVSGDGTVVLPDEEAVIRAMRTSVGL
jgi:shikimate dehydrogenase